MKKILLFFLFLLFVSCNSNPQPPKWFNKVYNSQLFIYGKGSGYSRESAINNALSNAASQISVTINSTYQMSKNLYETKKYSKEVRELRKQIQSEVKNIDFANYQIINEKKVDDKYYILVKINKIDTAEILAQKAKEIIESVKPDLKINDKVRMLRVFNDDIKKLNQAISDLSIANILEKNKYNELLTEAIRLKNKFKEKLNNVGVFVVANNPKIKNLFEDVFTQLNIPLSYNGVKVKVKSKFRFKKIMRYYVAMADIKIYIKDKTLQSYEIKCGGKSISNFNLALDFALNECKTKVKNLFKRIF
jgi:tetratricopeptide (TPR) repeat protein